MEELLRQAFQLGQQWVQDMNNDKEPMNFNEWYVLMKYNASKILYTNVVGRSEQLVVCKKCGSSEMYQYTKAKDKCEDCGNIQDY